MISGDGCGLSFPDICLTVEKKPHPGKLTWPGIEPGPLGERQRCYPLTRAVVLIVESFWSTTTAAQRICEVEGEDVFSQCVAQRWFQHFNTGEENTKHLPCSGRSKLWDIENIQGALKFPLQTSRTCRGDWVDDILNWNPCPETYHFRATAVWKQALPERTSRPSTSITLAIRSSAELHDEGCLRPDHMMSIDVYPTSRSWFEPHSRVFQC